MKARYFGAVRIAAAILMLGLSTGSALAQKWVTAAPIPQGAEEVYGIVAGGKLYVFGGLAIAWKPIGMVMEYDPAADRWTRKRDMPAYHHHFALAEVNGRIYMFGGYTLPEKGQPTWVPVNNSWEYDREADAWKPLAPMPQARGSISAVSVDGRIHLIGGATLPAGAKEEWLHPSRNVSVATHEVYDPAANTWSKRADMPTPRNHAASGVIDGRIVVAGGRAGSVFIPNAINVDIVEEYNPATDQWILRAPMPTPRSATTWGVHGGRLYVAGGEIRHRDYWATCTPFDDFRDALVRGDRGAAARYPLAAQRGLRLFVGAAKCNVCHFGPQFTNGEFDKAGIPVRSASGRFDWGRYDGIKSLLASRFNRLSRHSDDRAGANTISTRHVALNLEAYGAFKVPGLRNVALTAPYMHNGSLASLRDVVTHYSGIDAVKMHIAVPQPHAEPGEPVPERAADSILRPLNLSAAQIDDMVAFLETLTEKSPLSRRPAPVAAVCP